MNRERKVKISDKYALTIEEAAEYFNIGENKLRELIKEPGCNFVLIVGHKNLIKRNKMEAYLNEITYI